MPEDTNKVNVLNRLCHLNNASDSKNALNYGKDALRLARNIKFNIGLAKAAFCIGRVYRITGDFEKSIEFQVKAKKIFLKYKIYSLLSDCIQELGISYRKKGDFSEALKYMLESLKLNRKIKDGLREGNVASSLSLLYQQQKNYNRALDYSVLALKIHKKFKVKGLMAIDYNNLGNIYYYKDSLNKSLYFYEQYRKLKEELNDQRSIGLALSNIGFVYAKQNKHHLNISYQKQAIEIFEKLGLLYRQFYPLQSLSESYASFKDFKMASFFGKKALEIAENTGSKYKAWEISKTLATIHKQAGNFERSLFYFQKYKAYADSIFNEKKTRQIVELETKYETEKKEQENQTLKLEAKQRNNLIVAGAVGGGLLLLLAVVLYRGNRRKQKTNQVLRLQKQEIEAQNIAITQQAEKLKATNEALEQANALIQKERDEKVKIYLQEATEATHKLQEIQETLAQRGPDITQKLLTNEINTAGELSIIQEKVRNEFPGFADEIDKALADKKITKVIWQVGYCLKFGRSPAEIAKILPISNRTVSVYGSKLRKLGVLEAVNK